MKKKLFIYGASGHGKVICDCVRRLGYCVEGFIDDREITSFYGYPVFKSNVLNSNDSVIIGIGDGHLRDKVACSITSQFISVIHPNAVVSSNVSIKEGSVVLVNASVLPGAEIGKHSIINTKASVDHDCKIGNYVHIAPGVTLCGNVSVGDYTWIGAGATVIQGISIGNNVMIGAGSLVIKDVPDNVTVVGVPAKELKCKSK